MLPTLTQGRTREDNDRMKKFCLDRQREREERELAELEKGKATDRATYEARGWPT
jgi:hypothetical protein